MFVDVEKTWGLWGGRNKLQLHPTDLTYSTPVMGRKGLWGRAWCRVRRVVGWFMSLVVRSSVAKNGQ
jgi:hypothetical protein